jgi:hypothetical protein
VSAVGDAVGREVALREQLASFRPLLALSMVMTRSRDETEILRIITTVLPSLGRCRPVGVYLDGDWRLLEGVGYPPEAKALGDQLAALDRCGAAVEVPGAGWAWAYPLLVLDEQAGYLVMGADTEPDGHHQFLLNVLVQQASVALVNARLHAQAWASAERERHAAEGERAAADGLRAANLALEQAMTSLAQSSAALQRSLDIHNRFTAATSAGEGQEGIARALHELTGLAVAVEDRHGNLTAWAGPGQPDPYPKQSPARREQTLQRARQARGLVRERDRLIAVAQPGTEVLGVIALIDPNRVAQESDRIALEHANTVLALELAHLQALGEVELRLRRDLVEELLAGTDPTSAQERARALGYDLSRPHRVVLVTNGHQRLDHESFYHAVHRAVRIAGVGSLLAARAGAVAVLCGAEHDWNHLHAAITAQLGGAEAAGSGSAHPAPTPPSSSARTNKPNSP